MDIVDRPEVVVTNGVGKMKDFYLRIVEAKPQAISVDVGELRQADIAQLYRYAKKDKTRLHTTTKGRRFILWVE